jgi:hypothetical protein
MEAQKLGEEAHRRGASLDDNPFHPDHDESAGWSYGWLQTDIQSQVAKAQSVMSWVLMQLSIVHECARGGASGEEIAGKIATIVEKIEPYIPYREEKGIVP